MQVRKLLIIGCLAAALLTAGAATPKANGPDTQTTVTEAQETRSLTANPGNCKPPRYLCPGIGLPKAPRAGCDSRWCAKVRTTRRMAVKLMRGLERWEAAGGNRSPLSDYRVLVPIVRAARNVDVSPYLVVAISGKESSFAVVACQSNRHNSTGLGSCGPSWTVANFCGKRVAIYELASYAHGMWATGQLIRCLLPNATVVEQLHGYAASSTWKPAVRAILDQWFNVPDHVTWNAAVKATR